jgi:hypothetical protein
MVIIVNAPSPFANFPALVDAAQLLRQPARFGVPFDDERDDLADLALVHKYV